MDRFQDRASIRKRTLVVLASLEPLAMRTAVETLVAPRDRYLAAAAIDELAEEGLVELLNTIATVRVRLTDAGRSTLLTLPGDRRPVGVGLPGGEARRAM